jgi:hypothetical protein
LLKCLHDGHAEGGHVHMPWFYPSGENKQGKRRQHQAVDDLGNENLHFARVAVGSASRDRRQKESRYCLNSAHQSQLERGIRQLVNQPTARHLIHPERHGGK